MHSKQKIVHLPLLFDIHVYSDFFNKTESDREYNTMLYIIYITARLWKRSSKPNVNVFEKEEIGCMAIKTRITGTDMVGHQLKLFNILNNANNYSG